MRKEMTMAAISAALAAIALTAQPNANTDKKQNATPDKKPAVILAAPYHQSDAQTDKAKPGADAPSPNAPGPDPNWVLVVVGSVTCVVIAWQSYETRKAAGATKASAEAALVQTNLQAIAMKQWVDVKVVEVANIGRFQSPVYPYELTVTDEIEISLKAANPTPYPLTFHRAKIFLSPNGTDEEFFFDCAKEIQLIPGSSKGSSLGLLIVLNLGEAAMRLYKEGHLQFSIVGDIAFTPIVGPMEVHQFGFLAQLASSDEAELPMVIEMTQQAEGQNPN